MYVQGRVLDIQGRPIAGAVIETWETDENGFYDTQYPGRDGPECRGRITSDTNGTYKYRAVVPVSYPIPGDVSVITGGYETIMDLYSGTCWGNAGDVP